MDRFEKIFDYLLKVEGGYSDDKNDKGGKTKYGIIEEEARDFGYKGNMQDLTIDFAKNIYLKKYYLGNKLDKVNNDKVALSICDWAVNSGKNGIKNAQIAINQLTNANLDVDGIIGNKTLEALNAADPEKFLEVYHNLQRIYYRSKVETDKTQEDFLTGWLNRVDRKEQYLKDWNKENVGTENKKFSFSQRSLNRLEGVHPALQTLIKLGITDSPHDFMVVQGLRTAAYQNELYQQGRTKPGPKVTNCDGYKSKSNHQAKSDGYGHAIDFAIYDPALPDKIDWNNEKKYREVADHLKKVAKENGINIVWGGDWVKFKDYPHIELV
nr:MAG TPA: Lysozyme [Caudoviricetes sp.]